MPFGTAAKRSVPNGAKRLAAFWLVFCVGGSMVSIESFFVVEYGFL